MYSGNRNVTCGGLVVYCTADGGGGSSYCRCNRFFVYPLPALSISSCASGADVTSEPELSHTH